MKRPFIYIHSLMSLDGKLVGNFTKLPEERAAAPFFQATGFGGPASVYDMDAWLNGTTTAITDFTYGAEPELDEDAVPVPAGDFLAAIPEEDAKPDSLAEGKTPLAKRYLVVLDRKGSLGWQDNKVPYGNPAPYVISVLTDRASNAYKDFLRRKNISYVICGEEQVDFDLLFDKLVNLFGIQNLKIGGGGAINWSLLRAGYVDEVSLVMVPAADGSDTAPSFFDVKEGMSDDTPIAFEYMESKVDEKSGAIWARYRVKKVWDREEFAAEYGLGQKDFVGEDGK